MRTYNEADWNDPKWRTGKFLPTKMGVAVGVMPTPPPWPTGASQNTAQPIAMDGAAAKPKTTEPELYLPQTPPVPQTQAELQTQYLPQPQHFPKTQRPTKTHHPPQTKWASQQNHYAIYNQYIAQKQCQPPHQIQYPPRTQLYPQSQIIPQTQNTAHMQPVPQNQIPAAVSEAAHRLRNQLAWLTKDNPDFPKSFRVAPSTSTLFYHLPPLLRVEKLIENGVLTRPIRYLDGFEPNFSNPLPNNLVCADDPNRRSKLIEALNEQRRTMAKCLKRPASEGTGFDSWFLRPEGDLMEPEEYYENVIKQDSEYQKIVERRDRGEYVVGPDDGLGWGSPWDRDWGKRWWKDEIVETEGGWCAVWWKGEWVVLHPEERLDSVKGPFLVRDGGRVYRSDFGNGGEEGEGDVEMA